MDAYSKYRSRNVEKIREIENARITAISLDKEPSIFPGVGKIKVVKNDQS